MPRERLVNFLKHWKLCFLFAGMVWAALMVFIPFLAVDNKLPHHRITAQDLH